MRRTSGIGRILRRLLPVVLLIVLVVQSVPSVRAQATIDIWIGALFYLTGESAASDRPPMMAAEYAVEEINRQQEEMGSPYRVRLMIEDSNGDSNRAREVVIRMADLGIRAVMFGSSSEIAAVQDIVAERGMLVISHWSTAPALSIPGDLIFRLVPDDTKQGRATASVISELGIRNVVALHRDDVWGRLLLDSTRNELTARGGSLTASRGYPPDSGTFRTVTAWLDEQVRQAAGRDGASRVGVLLLSFDEGADIMKEALQYPALANVRWFGSDSTAVNPAFLDEAAVARLAASVCFANPAFGGRVLDQPGYQSVAAVVAERSGLDDVGFYAVAAYDAIWLTWETLLAAGTDAGPDVLGETFTEIARGYPGATGTIVLNEAGDRELGDFDFWVIQSQADGPRWVKSGSWFDLGPTSPALRLSNCLASGATGAR